MARPLHAKDAICDTGRQRAYQAQGVKAKVARQAAGVSGGWQRAAGLAQRAIDRRCVGGMRPTLVKILVRWVPLAPTARDNSSTAAAPKLCIPDERCRDSAGAGHDALEAPLGTRIHSRAIKVRGGVAAGQPQVAASLRAHGPAYEWQPIGQS